MLETFGAISFPENLNTQIILESKAHFQTV